MTQETHDGGRRRRWVAAVGAGSLALAMCAAAASTASAQGGNRDRPGAPDTTVRVPGTAVVRASWLSDRFGLQVGDLITVVVDEATAARERVSKVATGDRSQAGTLRADLDTDAMNYGVSTGMRNGSRDVGEANREGDFTAVLTVRVTEITSQGLARIQGSKGVSVDGRRQDVAVQGVVRPQDVSPKNTVLSSRIADAVITYKGKSIGPRTGIIGKFLNMLWP